MITGDKYCVICDGPCVPVYFDELKDAIACFSSNHGHNCILLSPGSYKICEEINLCEKPTMERT